MTRVDFYILQDVDQFAKQRFGCRLAHKAVMEGQRVHVRTETPSEVDDLMWDYPPQRFLPHATLANASRREPVTIGSGDEVPAQADVLINLADDISTGFANFARVCEVVLASERAAGRDRYRHYREQGYPLFHHEPKDWE